MGYEQEVSSKKKLLGFILVVLLHVVLIYALINGLAQDFVKKIKHEALEVNIIEEIKLPPPPPPPPPPKQTAAPKVNTPPPPAYVPPVEVKVQTTDSQNSIAAVSSTVPTETTVTAPPAPVEPAPKPHVAVRTKASLNGGCTRPSYPAESIEMEEEGSVTLGFQIDVDGHVVESKIIKSSGFARLDNAAKEAFSKCEFTPATVDGVAEKSLATVPFEWKIK